MAGDQRQISRMSLQQPPVHCKSNDPGWPDERGIAANQDTVGSGANFRPSAVEWSWRDGIGESAWCTTCHSDPMLSDASGLRKSGACRKNADCFSLCREGKYQITQIDICLTAIVEMFFSMSLSLGCFNTCFLPTCNEKAGQCSKNSPLPGQRISSDAQQNQA